MKGRVHLVLRSGQLHRIWIYVVVISAIVASATPVSALYYTQSVIVLFLASCVPFVNGKISKRPKFKSRPLLITFLIILLIFTTCFLNKDTKISYYIGVSLQVISAWMIMESYSEREYINTYIKIFIIISVYSTLLTLILNVDRALLQQMPLVYPIDSKIASWRTIYYIYNVWDIYAQFSIIRNSACFREPGVWGSFVILAILFKISQMRENGSFLREKSERKKDMMELLILVVGTITSLSTSTIVCLCLCVVIYFFNTKHTKKQLYLLGGAILAVLILLFRYQNLLFDKLNINSSSYISTLDRIQGVQKSIGCWLDSPFFGVGYTNYFATVTEGVNTFSFLFVLGEFGIIIFGIFLFMLFKAAIKRNFTGLTTVIVFIIFAFILNIQNLIFTPLILILMYYGISIYRKNKTSHAKKMVLNGGDIR